MTDEDASGNRSQRPTLGDIAHAASVSIATVSKVLNGRPGVGAETRERVEQMLAASGYARRVDTPDRVGVVELVVTDLNTDWCIEILRGASEELREAGLALTLSALSDDMLPEQNWLGGALARRPVAVIMQFATPSAPERQRLRNRNIPLVVLDPIAHPPADVSTVAATNWAGGVAATEHLLLLGHEKIAVITGPDGAAAAARFAGYQSAMLRAGVRVRHLSGVTGDFTREVGARDAHALLSAPDRPTAIVCANDLQALGAIDAAAALGLSVPRDVSVVGFDDVVAARHARPPLTTVRQPLRDMARTAVRIALDQRDHTESSQRVELATTLMPRLSTAPPRENGERDETFRL